MTSRPRTQTSQKSVKVVREGTKIVVPEDMDAREVLEWAQRHFEEQEKAVAIHADIPCIPTDGLVAMHRAIGEIYGWHDMRPTPTFFGDRPPYMVNVPVDSKKDVQVGYGRMYIPSIDGWIETAFKTEPVPALIIGGNVKNKDKAKVDAIVALTKNYVANHSIYQGKAIRVDLDWQRAGEDFDPFSHAPKFWDVSPRGEDTEPIFSKSVDDSLQVNLWSLIQYSDAYRRQHTPLKRGVLLSGPYGTGKTLSAKKTAQLCEANGWTFMHLTDVRDLTYALRLAQNYEPCVVFCEDIDQLVQGDRSVSLNDVLNTLDGVDTKEREVITVFTTNQLDIIHPSVLRPGRVDALVVLDLPDAEAAKRFVRQFGGRMIRQEEPLDDVSEFLAGKMPAVIREIVEMAKSAAITRIMQNGGMSEDIDLVGGQVTQDDLMIAARSKEMHNELINRERPAQPTIPERIADGVVNSIMTGAMYALHHAGALAASDTTYSNEGRLQRMEEMLKEAQNTMPVSTNRH